jgi:SpoVK/Ycf46/Vps4 family AAA+-type ATPase
MSVAESQKKSADPAGHSSGRVVSMVRAVFESARPVTYIRSAEEHRVAKILREAGQTWFGTERAPLWTWSLTEGMRDPDGKAAEGGRSPIEALDFIAHYDGKAIFHLMDFHEPLRDSPEVRRRLRDLYNACLNRQKFVVISSPVRFIPEEVARDLVYLELQVPDLAELTAFLREELEELSIHASGVDVSEADIQRTARSLQGLTLQEARHAIRRALASKAALGEEARPILLDEKRLLINRSRIIEFIADNTEIEQVGGLENLKAWLLERRRLFHARADLSADIAPKGVLVMGIPGCGKSLSVKAIASYFDLPLYRVDMIEIFSGRHGPPEGAFVQACKMLEEMAPAVVWFDEIEMGITSAELRGEHARIFAFFLTWMQEKGRGLFVAATANRIDLLPAEMIRKGRFDEIFFVDLPSRDERVEIFKVHLSRRGADCSNVGLEQVADYVKGFAGAEIEQCVISALTRARIESREVTENDLFQIAGQIVPLSRTMVEQIQHIRGWAYQRAVRASRENSTK